LWEKGPNVKDINKKFPVYGGKCLSRGKKRGNNFTDEEEVEAEGRKWLRQQTKDYCAAGFDSPIKRWEKCMNVDGGYVEK
jgi:hypothetical protein